MQPTSTPEPTATTAPAVTAQIGNKVGERAPDFELTLVDGSTVTLASLIETQRPAYLFFFASF